MSRMQRTVGACFASITILAAQWANAQSGSEGADFIITQNSGLYDHYVILRVVKVNDAWMEFEEVHGGWPAAVETRETEHLKFYEAAIWADDNSVNLYAFDDSFDSSYQYYFDFEANELKERPVEERVAHREQFLVKKFDQIPADGEAASSYLAAAFEEFFTIIQQRHPSSGLGLVYSGHGSGSGGLFANSIYPRDARELFIGATGKLDRKLDWFDLGGPCNEGQFEALMNFAPFFRYIVASDLPNGGYSFDEWDSEKFKETKADYLYPELLGPNMGLLETMKIIQQRRRLGYEYSLNNMIRDGVEQANYIYDAEQFLKFAAAFQVALLENQASEEAKIKLENYNDVLTLVHQLGDNALANLYEAVFLHKIDNKDFFAWNNDEHIAVNGMGYSNYGGWSSKSIIRLDLSEGGGMRWNTFQAVENSAQLVGVFPTNVPVRLEAEPMPGFAFVNWSGDLSGDLSPLTIEISGDMEISGIFQKTDEAPAPLEVAIRAANLNQVYNGQGREISVYSDPGGLRATVSYAGSNSPPILPGSYPVVVTIAETGISAEASFTLNIARARLTIRAQNATRIRGAENPEFAVDYIGFVNGEGPEVLELLPLLSTSATPASAEGEYPIRASGAAAQNYTIDYEPGILTIERDPNTWPVSEFSMAGGNLWWVYSSNLPAELAVGAEIIFAGTETPFDGLVCVVREISGTRAFQIESSLSFEAYPFEPSGLSGIWRFTSLREEDDSSAGATSPCEFTYALPSGWSMISLPCGLEDSSLGNLFPTAISLFEFDGGYQSATSMSVGRGYWINLPTAFEGAITGTRPASLSIDLPAGWSMVGPGRHEVPASSLVDNLISVFGFEGGYFAADALAPGRGYWTNLSTPGSLELSAPAAAKPGLALPENVGAGEAVLWVEGEGRQQMLVLGVQANEVEALPPVPPAGLFDVRAEVDDMGAWQVPRVSAARDFRLRLQGEGLQLGWQIPAAERGLWQLVLDGRIIALDGAGRVALESGAEEVFLRQAALPQAFSLRQNFPNPFNPATTIQYSLASPGPVSLQVYDLAGQLVRLLVDQRQGGGAHQVVWDGRDEAGTAAANGVYIYELRAGKYRAWRKMLLIK